MDTGTPNPADGRDDPRPTGRRPPLVVRIVEAIADARGEDSMAVPPLASYLDPEALERLVERTTVPTTVSIELHGCHVEVDAQGDVVARRLDPEGSR